ncbi:MAG: S8 family serine peptidase, partial [Nanoarchaeota archaeon]
TKDDVPWKVVHYQRVLEKKTEQYENEMSKVLSVPVEDVKKGEYTYVFYGVALDISAIEAKKLQTLSFVKAIYPNTKIYLTLMDSTPFIGATSAWNYGIKGEGIKIAIIDSGVDYTHPDLGGCFGINCKVSKGYDFFNKDSDPMDDHGHGTHVAATVAGNGKLKGVAPAAEIYAYKIFDAEGNARGIDLLNAIERATKDGADIISMSLGAFGSPDDPLSQAADAAVDAGVIVVVAAGNSGPGPSTISSPGTARKVITVGATYNDYDRKSVFTYNGIIIQSDGLARSKIGRVSGEIKNASGGSSADFASRDFRGKIALVKRSQNFVALKEAVDNAYNAGATGVIIYNNNSGLFSGFMVDYSQIPAISISLEDGKRLLEIIHSRPQGVIEVGKDDQLPKTVISFSSRGPVKTSKESFIKPDIVAPGVLICAAQSKFDKIADQYREIKIDVHCVDNTHIAISGTSMATPHVAGAAALIKQANPDMSPEEIKQLLKNTADDIGLDPNIQGAGVIDLEEIFGHGSKAPQSKIINKAPIDISGQLVMQLQKKESQSWNTIMTVINQSVILKANSVYKLDKNWNLESPQLPEIGIYRIFIQFFIKNDSAQTSWNISVTNNPIFSCFDSDNKNYFERGVVGGVDTKGNPFVFSDNCTENNLTEWTCFTGSPLSEIYACLEGCRDGRCFCTLQSCSSLQKECGNWDNGCGEFINCGTCSGGKICNAQGKCVENICTDSDGGINYFVKGTATDIDGTFNDYCIATNLSKILVEYYCSGTRAEKTGYVCNCIDGAC